MKSSKHISLSHGSGGIESNELIEGLFYEILGDFVLDAGEDAGLFHSAYPLGVSTDSYVVSPLFFPGGDIGKLCVCGSSNDVAMRGAKPKYISLAFILEEGMNIGDLKRILQSIAIQLRLGDLKILTGDTKVVPKGHVDKIYINTTAIGEIKTPIIPSAKHLQEDDAIIVSAPVGTHGAVIFCSRNEIALESELQSDCAQLYPMIEPILNQALEIHAMRDATRGGLAAVLNEWARVCRREIIVQENLVSILPQVRGVCEILGLEALSLANEGVCVLSVPQKQAKEVLSKLQFHPLGQEAQIIGRVGRQVEIQQARVIIKNAWGSERYLEYPQGELLPRIC